MKADHRVPEVTPGYESRLWPREGGARLVPRYRIRIRPSLGVNFRQLLAATPTTYGHGGRRFLIKPASWKEPHAVSVRGPPGERIRAEVPAAAATATARATVKTTTGPVTVARPKLRRAGQLLRWGFQRADHDGRLVGVRFPARPGQIGQGRRRDLVKVGGRWRYLYRAVDQFGQVVDVLL